VICPSCRTDNPDGARFCTGCGGALGRACPQCGSAVAASFRFCPACGHGLEAAPPAAASIEAARRQVAILFADLSGFTRLSGSLDPEETHALLDRFFAAVDRAVAAYGGRVDKHIGDAVMAVFGAPVAHGNDAERALRAALEVHAGVAALAADTGRALAVHVGVASGEVVASGTGSELHREYTVTGDSVNLAARLTERAQSGETLISDALRRAAGDLAVVESAGEIELKGFARPQAVWCLHGIRAVGSVARPPLVGRQPELRQFTGVLAAAGETGRGAAVLLRGEPGIGKTRLAEEFERIAGRRGFACHAGLVLDFGAGKGEDAIRTVVRRLVGLPAGAGKSVRAETAERAIAAGDVAEDQRAALADLLDLPQGGAAGALWQAMDSAMRSRTLQETLGGLVRRAAARKPLLIKVEDVHWADPPLLGQLAAIARAAAAAPAVLVMTTRIDGDPIDQAWRAGSRGCPLFTIDLAPLSGEEAVELAAGIRSAEPTLIERCIARADGNPLFLEQLLRNIEDAEAETIPASLQSLVQARVDRLPAKDRQALQAAAVIGQRFDLAPLRHLLGDSAYDATTLLQRQLVRPDGEGFLFAHALVRDGVYAALLKARRRELHASAAAWYAGRDPLLHAEHLERAEDPAAAAAYLAAAAAQAAAFRYERALGLVERGLARAGAGDRTALDLLRGEVLHELGRVEEAIAAYGRAEASAGSDDERCRALIGRVASLRILARHDEALATAARAEEIATARQLTAELARINYLRGNLCFMRGDIDECLQAHRRSLAFAQAIASPEAEARALGGLGDAYYLRGRMRSAFEHFDRCVRLAEANGLVRVGVANRAMRGDSRCYLLEMDAGLVDVMTALDGARRIGDYRAELVAVTSAGILQADLGNLAEARRLNEEGIALARRVGAGNFEGEALGGLGAILCQQGDLADGRRMIDRALELARATGMSYMGPIVLSWVARFGADAAARAAARAEAEAILAQGCVGHNYLWYYRDMIDVALAEADWPGAERYAACLEDYTRAEPLPLSDLVVARGRALAAFGRGRRDDALAAELGRLAERTRAAGMKPLLPALDAALAG
jgi:class 3 adenylate cyclase/tetratricopeptide (TPR) repeat protein